MRTTPILQHILTCSLLLAAAPQLHAQAVSPVRDTVTVVGQLDPATQGESERATTSTDVQAERLTAPGVPALLRTDSSVDIEERGGGGTQDDVSIRGSSYEQTLVLLNGLRINDAETSHFNLDLPIPMDALSAAYVLHGAGSTLYGSDAVSGVVNLTTQRPQDAWSARLRAGAGSFGGNTQSAVLGVARKRWSEVLAGGREFSEGFMADRDFRSEQLSSETWLDSALGHSDVLLGASDRAFGANQFYGDYDSWERTKGWFAALTQQFDIRTQAAFAWRRHTDEFVLLREAPSVYENNHIDRSVQGIVRRTDDVRKNLVRFDYGVDVNADQISSSSLGRHGRNREAVYLDARVRLGERGTASVGMREEVVAGGLHVFVPTLSAAYNATSHVKLRGDLSRGFRLPTYTDLYYNDPANHGNAKLQPEFAWTYEGGVDWYFSAKWAISATGYTSQQSNVIDYVRLNSASAYYAENLTHVGLSGVEASAEWHPKAGQQVRVALTTVAGVKSALDGYESKYAFNYPSENATVEWNAHFKRGLALRETLRVVNRFNGQTYSVFDSSIAYERSWLHPYLQMTNLGDASYQEVLGVQMPPRGFAGGIEIELRRR